MGDILFKTEDWVFSYRVAGICIHNGCVLLQTTKDDNFYAFPGGHVALGETNADTLIREFREEIGAEVRIRELKWVAENFFPWGSKPCHQLCNYFLVELAEENTPKNGIFQGRENHLEFHWVPIEKVGQLEIYPTNARELLGKLEEGVQYFVYRE